MRDDLRGVLDVSGPDCLVLIAAMDMYCKWLDGHHPTEDAMRFEEGHDLYGRIEELTLRLIKAGKRLDESEHG